MKYMFLGLMTISILMTSCTSEIEAPSSSKIKIMSFNIRNGKARDGENHWTKRKNMVYKVINNYGSDFIGLQEAYNFQTQAILENCKAYSSTGVGRDGKDQGEFSNILYKKEVYKILDSGTFWLSDTPEKISKSWGNSIHRICSWALFENKQNGNQVYVFNTHFDHRSQASRIRSSRLITDRIKNRKKKNIPFLITGDFNATPDTMEMNYFYSNNITDSDNYVSHSENNRGTFSGFKFKSYNRKIDYILFSDEQWKVIKSEIVRYSENQRYPSDHFPVYAEFTLKK